jgi:beta-glucosidase
LINLQLSAFKTLPYFHRDITTTDGSQGFDATWHSHDEHNQPISTPAKTGQIRTTKLFIAHTFPNNLTPVWTLRLKGYFRPVEEDTLYNFGLTVTGRAKLFIDGQLVIDNWTVQTYSKSYLGHGTIEERGQFLLKKGTKHEIFIEYCNIRGPQKGEPDKQIIAQLPEVQCGAAPAIDPDEEIEKAVAIAKKTEVSVIVVGLNANWESSGYDRADLTLPGRTNELVRRVAAVNSKTIVVTQSVCFMKPVKTNSLM